MLNDPPKLLERLAAADREHQKEAGAKVLLRSVKHVGAIVLGLFVLDVIFHLTAGWRLALLLLLLAGLCALGIFCWRLAYVRRNRLEHIARFLETRDPALGSRLINWLQLNDQADDPTLAPMTRQLARQAVADYAAGLQSAPLEKLARTGEPRLQLKRAAWALLAFVAILAAAFRVTEVELARFADPLGDHPPYSFTHLQILQPGPAGAKVLYDKGIVMRVKAGGHRPKEVFLTAFPPGHPEKAVTLPMFDKGAAGYDQLLGNIQSRLIVYAHTKDHVSESKRVSIEVVLTPQLETAFVQVSPPAYTGIPPQEKPYNFKDTQALEGSEVSFRLESNRPLRDGTLELAMGDESPRTIALKKTSAKEVSGSFLATESGRMRFAFTDVDGLRSQGDFDGALTVTHDLPPSVEIVNPNHDAFVAMDFKLQAQIEGSDDYGLREIRLHRGLNGVFSAPKIFSHTNMVRESRETFDFDFAKLGLQPGDVVSLFAEALDNAPQPHLSRSQVVRVQLISVEDYNNFLRERSDIADAEAKYDALNQDLHDLVEQQKQLGAEIQKLNGQLAKAGGNRAEALAQQLDNLMAKQNELNDRLNRQAERMENFVRDQPVYDVEKDLQELLRRQAAEIRQSTQTNNDATRAIAQRSSPANGPRRLTPEMIEDFQKASDDQIARLGGVRDQTDQQVVQTLEDLDQMQELIKDFNQFEALYREQQDVAQQAQPYNRAGRLEREDQLALKDLASTENQMADYLGLLQDKLRRDAQAAEKLFPKAAKSGKALADQMEGHRFQSLAAQATSKMLAVDGEEAFGLADRLRAEMAALFSQCQAGGNCPGSNELDNYLRLQRMNPNQNFAQMSRSRKFGFGFGKGRAGRGENGADASGYAMTDGSPAQVLGNESSLVNGAHASRQSSRFGKGAGAPPSRVAGEMERPDTIKNLNPVNRQSGAVAAETIVEQYNDVVENYFKAITTGKEKPSEQKN